MIFELLRTSFLGITQVLAVGVLGALIIGGLRPSMDAFDVLSRLFVRITLPCLVFSNMAEKFSVDGVSRWWVFPLLGVGLFLAGGLLGFGYSLMDRDVCCRGVFIASLTFHNSILLPLAFAPVLFGPDRLPTFLNLLFLYNILTIPVFFSVGVWMVQTDSAGKFQPLKLLNPPVVATLLGLLFAVTGWHEYVPRWMMSQMKLMGSLSSPLSILIVGGIVVVSFLSVAPRDLKEPVKITVLKSLVLPALATLFVVLFRPSEYVALFIIMGAAMPVGSIIAVIIPRDERIRKMVAGGILLSNLAGIVTIPLFLSVFGVLYGW